MNYDIYGRPLKPKRQPVAKSQKSAVRITQGGRCERCHKILTIEEFHHVKHVAKNGKSTTGNLVALCPSCHKIIHIEEKAKVMDKKRNKKDNNPFGLPTFKMPKF